MAGRLRLAELMAGLSLATDLGMGQPMEQALRTCLIALRLAALAQLPSEEFPAVYYGALLRFLGCTANAHETARLTGDDIAFRQAIAPVFGARPQEVMRSVFPTLGKGKSRFGRARQTAGFLVRGAPTLRAGVKAHCEVGDALAASLDLSQSTRLCLLHAFEHWNGRGLPSGVRGEAISPAARVVSLARDLEVLGRAAGPDEAVGIIARRRKTGAYDPGLVELARSDGVSMLRELDAISTWEAVLEGEPEPHRLVPAGRIDAVLEAFADFADLKMPFMAGHSRAVAELAQRADPSNASKVRPIALLQDLGRVAVPNPVWEKPGPLTSTEWELVRLHPYYSERVLARCTALRSFAEWAGMHHERMNGSGYYRGLQGNAIPSPVCIVAAADTYQAMTEERPHRPALGGEAAARELRQDVKAGRLDAAAVESVLEAAGHPRLPIHKELPAGLTEREVEVLGLIGRGASKRETADRLHISPATVDHHVRHIYDKIGVTTRAGAAIFAMQHRLLFELEPK